LPKTSPVIHYHLGTMGQANPPLCSLSQA
jgi:hypothetical protein